MRPPEFWNATDGRDTAPVLRALLTPASALYAWAGAERLKRAKPERAAAPVICVGNVTLGGTGKTPVVQAIGAILDEWGLEPHILSRGYGGREKGPVRVEPDSHAAADVGDEPLLHALDRPTWIARDRAAGARAAAHAGARAIVMDDGFQNPDLVKDVSILVFDIEAGLGNGCVFPAGPLREPLARALSRADLVVLMQPDPTLTDAPDWLADYKGPVARAWLEPVRTPPDAPIVAFAGIGRPQKFFDTLERAGGQLVEAVPFPDHYVYSADDLDWLETLAGERGAKLMTTEKDYARLPRAWRMKVSTLPVYARFADETPLRTLLRERLAQAQNVR